MLYSCQRVCVVCDELSIYVPHAGAKSIIDLPKEIMTIGKLDRQKRKPHRSYIQMQYYLHLLTTNIFQVDQEIVQWLL